MKAKTVKGTIATPMYFKPTDITIRADKTRTSNKTDNGLITLSLADDKAGIMIEVKYKDIERLVRGL